MALNIVYYGNPCLKQPGVAVAVFDDAFKCFTDDLLQTLIDTGALGLAAQHVGKPLSLCVINLGLLKDHPEYPFSVTLDGTKMDCEHLFPLVLVNPKLNYASETLLTEREGSVSFPGISLKISRPSCIKVVYDDVAGHHHSLEASGYLARVIQHEVDQSNGILFTERAAPRDLNAIASKLKQIVRKNKKSA